MRKQSHKPQARKLLNQKLKIQQNKVTWTQFQKDIQKLIKDIPKKRFTKILAISKGGLVPAYYLARYLDIKTVRTLCVSSYTNKNEPTKLRVFPASQQVDNRQGWLVVDDLVDSGRTIELAKKYYPNSKVAVLYTKKHSPKISDYSVSEQEGWIVFPWE